MEGFFLLVGLALLAFPVLAIAAWIRAGNLRQRLDDRDREIQRTVSDLRGEIATLRRTLANVTEKVATGDGASAETKVATPVPETVTPPVSKAEEPAPLPDRMFYVAKPILPVPVPPAASQPSQSSYPRFLRP